MIVILLIFLHTILIVEMKFPLKLCEASVKYLIPYNNIICM